MNDDTALHHRQIWELIPWLVNGTAAADDRQRVERHLLECDNCREEFEFQNRVFVGMNGADEALEPDPQPGLRRLFARIDDAVASAGTHSGDESAAPSIAAIAPAPLPLGGVRQRWGRVRTRVVAAAFVAQTAALLVLGVVLLGTRQPGASAAYQTLSSAPAAVAAATIRFVPAPSLTVGALQAMLADAHLRIVESNQGSSIYGLAPESPGVTTVAATTQAVARLRRQGGVLLVEPIVMPGADAH